LSETQVIQFFLSSAEYHNAHPSDASFVDRIDVNLLGRVETPGEQAAWLQYQQNHTRDQAEDIFLHVSEFDRRVVDSYYANLLRRAPDPAGESNWVNCLLSGNCSLESVAEAFLASDEFFAKAAAGLL
jgi:hypothetical protein